MKKIRLTVFSVTALLFFSACSSEDIIDGKGNGSNSDEKKTTTFASVGNGTRTSMINHQFHTGGDFLWENDDQIFVNIGGNYSQSTASNLSSSKTRATFEVPGALTASSYPVTYTGKDATAGDRVKIANEQIQSAPGNTQHFGVSGDCGVATATKAADGTYTFTLQHKAVYLCFMPSMTEAGLYYDLRLDRIKVTSDNNIAGTYSFSAAGLSSNAVSDGSNSITLRTAGSTHLQLGFPMTNTIPDVSKAAYMVIAPGQHTLKIEYVVKDQVSGVEWTTTKTATANFIANKVYDFTADVSPKVFRDYGEIGYFMWGARDDFFAGRPRTAFVNGSPVVFPETTSPSFANMSVQYPQASPASAYGVNPINVNEALWIMKNGDIHWDEDIYWIADKHLWKNGTWIKKRDNIANYSKDEFEGNDYTRNAENASRNGSITPGRPASNIDNYFFLPAFGEIVSESSSLVSRGDVLYLGCKTLCPTDNTKYYYFGISKHGTVLSYFWRNMRAYPPYFFE